MCVHACGSYRHASWSPAALKRPPDGKGLLCHTVPRSNTRAVMQQLLDCRQTTSIMPQAKSVESTQTCWIETHSGCSSHTALVLTWYCPTLTAQQPWCVSWQPAPPGCAPAHWQAMPPVPHTLLPCGSRLLLPQSAPAPHCWTWLPAWQAQVLPQVSKRVKK